MKRYIILTVLIIMLIIGLIAFGKAFGKKDGTIKQVFKQEKYKEYKSGDLVSLNNQEWYVLYDSSDKDNYVTLFYKGVLYLEENGIADSDYSVYESSDLNKYLKGDFADYIGTKKLREVNGYKVRLFNNDDLKLLNVKYDKDSDSYEITDCPEFICLTNTFYATMIATGDAPEMEENEEEEIEPVHLSYYNLSTTYETFKLESVVEDKTLFVRPVINVYKESLDE